MEALHAALAAIAPQEIAEDWFTKLVERILSVEGKAQIEASGGWEKLMESLKQRLDEQKGRYQGGSKWIGAAATSPFGAYGYIPEGVGIGQDKSRKRSAVNVWDQCYYRDCNTDVEFGIRQIRLALRRLRKFARIGAEQERTWIA